MEDFELELEEIQQIFPNGFDKKRIECSLLQRIAKEHNIDVPKFSNVAELHEAIKMRQLHTEDARCLIVNAMDVCKMEYDSDMVEKRFKKIDRLFELLYTVFDIYPKAGAFDTTEVNKTANTAKESPASVPAKAVTDNTLSDFVLPKAGTIELIMRYGHKDICSDIDFQPLKITENLPVEIKDNMRVRYDDNMDISRNCVAIVDDSIGKCVAVGEIAVNGSDKCLVFNSANIDYDQLEYKETFKLMLFPKDVACIFNKYLTEDTIRSQNISYLLADKDITVRFGHLENTDRILCIDFGTSNTTVGSYNIIEPFANKPELVQFVDVTADEDELVMKYTLPTMVYIARCSTDEIIEYKFGYEAKKELTDQNFNPKGSLFSEIKRWINSMDKTVKVHDAYGNTTVVTHKSIIKAYLKHVINCAQRHFKVHFEEIHFSAPVKLKGIFIKALTDMFKGEYRITKESESLDEGVAIVYDMLTKEIDRDRELLIDGRERSMLIIDCGGGTTDLASCKYHLNAGTEDLCDQLIIKTDFVNGDSNFGGNNITFRIMQLLKVKIAATRDDSIDSNIMNLISHAPSMILNQIDLDYDNKTKIYKIFNSVYEQAEKVIPTKYDDSDFDGDRDKKKRNFYYLWEMAEKLKIAFHDSTREMNGRAHVDFNKEQSICIDDENQYYLYVYDESGNLVEYEKPLHSLEITINEITQVLYADLYGLLNSVLPLSDQEDGEVLQKFNSCQFTGQSCHINLFLSLFKEFIPGKRMRNIYAGVKEVSGVELLKLPCVIGCIRYIMARKSGNLDVIMQEDKKNMIYTVEDKSRNKLLLSANELNVKIERYSSNEANIEVVDKNGQPKNRFNYVYKTQNTDRYMELGQLMHEVYKVTYLDRTYLDEKIKRKLEDYNIEGMEFVNQENNAVKAVFAVPAKSNYGMNIFFVVIDKKHRYYMQDAQYFSFEDEELECFFNGKR